MAILSKAGVGVDDQRRPVRADGRALDGVFVVGELLGLVNFSGDGYASGMSIGSSLALGRALGLRLGSTGSRSPASWRVPLA